MQPRSELGDADGAGALERIDEVLDARSGVLHHEVTGEADAGDRQAAAPTDLEIHDRQRDGDAEPAVEYLIQEGVRRIEVVELVAAKALAREQFSHSGDGVGRRGEGRDLRGDDRRELIQPR